MADGSNFKICFFGHNSADCLISVKFCVGNSLSQNFGDGTNTGVAQNVFFCIRNVVLPSASGAFHIVFDTFVTGV